MLENYGVNNDGVVFQRERVPFTYDPAYVESRYDTYGELNGQMSHLRLGYVLGTLGYTPDSVCDVGYGNGAFLKACASAIPKRFGYDISGYPAPSGVTVKRDWLTTPVDLLCFFDVLEHFDDPYILRNARADHVVISLPWCHYHSDAWFAEWKHRRPNEHLWHFDAMAMDRFAHQCGYRVLEHSNVEDVIRKSTDSFSNILTVVLERQA